MSAFDAFDALGDVARWATMSKSSNEGTILKDWIHASLRCKAIQGPFGINGYVAVPKNHPAWGKSYYDVDVEVHGGLTFGKQGEEDNEKWPDSELYWFGWDTAHGFSGHWSLEDVVAENNRLATQLSNCLQGSANDE